jgi:hypothetical protein
MKPRSRSGSMLALGLALTVSGCATAINGTKQEVSFASDPPGAAVFVDGANMGTTPVAVKIARSDPHQIRIEKPGYVGYETKMVPSSDSRWYMADVVPAMAFPPLVVIPLADHWLGGTSQVQPARVTVHLLAAAASVPSTAAMPAPASVTSASDKGSLPSPKNDP